jgi:hemin uptake protein HemP
MENFVESGQPLEEPLTDWINSFAAIVIAKEKILGYISSVELTQPRNVIFTSHDGKTYRVPAYYSNFESISKTS